MATTPTILNHDPNKSITVDIFPEDSDTATLTSQTPTEATNRKGLYTLNVTSALDGIYYYLVKENGTEVARWEIDLQDTTDTCQCVELNTALSQLLEAYPDGYLYLDLTSGVAGTRRGKNGTFSKPANSWANIVTLMSLTKLKKVKTLEASTLTLTADFLNKELEGVRFLFNPAGFSLNYAKIDGAIFTSRTFGNTRNTRLLNCSFVGTNVFGSTTNEVTLENCLIDGTLTLNTTYFNMVGCNNFRPYTGLISTSPILNFNSVAGTISVKCYKWDGNLSITNANSANHRLDISGSGSLTIDSSCTNGTVNVYGPIDVTDNSGGAVTITKYAAEFTLADGAITEDKFDNSTAFPLASVDSGNTQIARTGADGDTLKSLSDQIDNVATPAQVLTQVSAGLVAIGLDHLFSVACTAGDVTDNSYAAKLVSKSATASFASYTHTTDSQEAIRDWIGDGTNLSEAGGTGDHLTQVPWNAAWDVEVQSEVEDGLAAYNAVATTDLPTNFSALAISGTGRITVGTNEDKSGYALSATGLNLVTTWTVNITGSLSGSVGSVTGGINTSGGAITTLDGLDSAQDIQHSTTQSTLSNTDSNVTTLLTGQPAQKYNGLRGPGIYVDTGAANTNTTLGTDGTVDNPVSSLAAATTLCSSLGANRIYLKGNSTLDLTGTTLTGFEFIGLNGPDSNTINLGTAASPSILTRVEIFDSTVYGTHDLSDRIELINCHIEDAPAAEITTLLCVAIDCLLLGDITLETSGSNIFSRCSDGIVGSGYPIINAQGVAGSVVFEDYQGDIGFNGFTASHDIELTGRGQVTYESGMNVNTEIRIAGHFKEIDSTAGMNNIENSANMVRSVVPTVSEIRIEIDSNSSQLATIVQDTSTDLPTLINSRTLATADYFNPATDVVANVTLVDTVTTNTDMRGTDNAALASNYTAARAGYLDNLNVGGQVASQADIQGITVSSRVKINTPPQMEIPSSGSTDYRIYIYSYNEQGQAEDLDSLPVVTAENNTTTDRSSNLGTVTKQAATTGIYYVDYSVASTHDIEGLVFKVAATENGTTTNYVSASAVSDSNVIGFTAADRTKLETIEQDTVTDLPTLINARSVASADYVVQSNLPTNFSDLAITSTSGKVTVGTNDDKTGYEIAGTITRLDDLENISAATVLTQVSTALSNYGSPTLVQIQSEFTTIKGATWTTTDTLEAIKNAIPTDVATETKQDLVKAQTDKLTFDGTNHLKSNTKKINDVVVIGTGIDGDEWRA